MTTPLHHLDITSPIGPLRLLARDDALTTLLLPGQPRPESRADRRQPILREAAAQLEAYFTGTRPSLASFRFSLKLEPAGTDFQREVWAALRRIPLGQTRSYGELAASLGRPSASRAVGAANGRNPLSIIVPCHRVIGANGALTGYAGGLPAKRWLLAHEGVEQPALALQGATL